MDEDRENIPLKERELQGTNTYVFGICKHCSIPIKYSPVKIPISCQEVRVQGADGVVSYNVEYADYHLSCAVSYMLKSQQVDFSIGVDLPTAIDTEKGSWLDKRSSKRVVKKNLFKDPQTFINVNAFEPSEYNNFTPIKEN